MKKDEKMIDEPSLWGKIISGLCSLVVGLLWYIKRHTDKKMETIEAALELKADKDELDRQRDHVAELFRENAAIRKDMNGGFQRITDLLHSGQIQIMSELSKKVDR